MNYEGIDYPLTRKDESSIIEWRIQRKTSDFLQCKLGWISVIISVKFVWLAKLN